MTGAYKLGKLNIEYTKAVMELNREIDRLRAENAALRKAATAYLDHSDSGVYRDSTGLRPGASPAAEDLRAALRGEGD